MLATADSRGNASRGATQKAPKKASYFPMGYFQPFEQRTAQLNARVTKSIKDGLEDLAKLWTHMEKARTGDDEVTITVSDVVNRLLAIGLDGAWSEIGGQPRTDAEWAKVLERAAKVFSPESPKK